MILMFFKGLTSQLLLQAQQDADIGLKFNRGAKLQDADNGSAFFRIKYATRLN